MKIDWEKLKEADYYEAIVYDELEVDGNESDALTDTYLELFELIGKDAMLTLYKHFRGDKIECPMKLYRPEFVADVAKQASDRRERAKIARACGFTTIFIESILRKRKTESDEEGGE